MYAISHTGLDSNSECVAKHVCACQPAWLSVPLSRSRRRLQLKRQSADNEDATANRHIMVLLSPGLSPCLSLSGYLSLFLDFPTVHQFIIINLAQTQLGMLGSSTTSHDNCPIVVATVATAAVVACFEFCCWLRSH